MVLNLSKNDIGSEGGKHLAKSFIQMRKLQTLILSECNITDRGLIEIISALDELGTVENLDLSGNQLGKSAHFSELTLKFEKLLKIDNLERIVLDDNNLRSQNGEKMLKAIC
jgi:Ran GTPase-activating protein (RanGAP) involved in mRNA processing and transport